MLCRHIMDNSSSEKDNKGKVLKGTIPPEGSQDKEFMQCKFFLKKKSRLCRFRPKPGQTYCPEHACVMGVQSQRKRIPCPLNPKHNCYEDEVQKHIKKCNVTKIQQNVEKAAYYMKGVNRGYTQESLPQTNQISVKDLTSQNLESLIERVQQLYNTHVEPIKSEHHQHSCVQEELSPLGDADLTELLKDRAGLRKELMQQAALVGQMQNEKLLEHGNCCFIELGAGKGKLSHWIHKASSHQQGNKFILVERGSVRYKMDGFMKQDKGETNFKRIKMDIEDLFLGRVPELESNDTPIIVGKHLCGGATDMGIRCAVNTLVFDKQSESEINSEATSDFVHLCESDNKGLSKQLDRIDSKSVENRPTQKNKDSCMISCETETLTDTVTENDTSTRLNLLEKDLLETDDVGKYEKSMEKTDKSEEPPTKSQRLHDQENVLDTRHTSKLPKGVLIALCCHHRCTWDTYVGRPFMEECGISPYQFDLITRLSSWATSARTRVKLTSKPDAQSGNNLNKVSPSSAVKPEETSNEHVTEDLITFDKNNKSLREQLSVPERERIGRLCKRLIDQGRLQYLRSRGMQAFLREYVEEDTTPENIVLIAHS